MPWAATFERAPRWDQPGLMVLAYVQADALFGRLPAADANLLARGCMELEGARSVFAESEGRGLVGRAGFEPAISCSQITRLDRFVQVERIRVGVSRLVPELRDPIAPARKQTL